MAPTPTEDPLREAASPPDRSPSARVTEDQGPGAMRWAGLIGGAALFVLLRAVPAPGSLPPAAWAAAAVALLMGTWWLTEAVPIPVTSLLPLALFPTLGVAKMAQAAAPYANEVIFLFMGGFFLGKAIEKQGLHRRLALWIIARVGTSPRGLLFGIMAATAFISMWISNTATAAMMLPIAIAVAQIFRPSEADLPASRPYNFGIALMLGIAYACSIGGIGTPIGTPPNSLFAAAAPELAGVQVTFLSWMVVGVPVVCVMLPLTWVILLRFYPPDHVLPLDAGAVIADERARLGRLSRGERWVSLVFSATVVAWVMREPKAFGAVTVPGIATFLPGVTDGTVAIVAALLLFAVPIDRTGTTALDWRFGSRIEWGVLLLFGGGLSLAEAMNTTGLAEWIGGGVGALAGAPVVVILLVTTTVFVFVGEFTSNTAMTAMGMPVMAAVAAPLGMHPAVLMAAVALACSMGFSLPAGTPPNAIVFGSGYLTIPQMVRVGIWINLLGVAVVTLAALLVVPLVFG